MVALVVVLRRLGLGLAGRCGSAAAIAQQRARPLSLIARPLSFAAMRTAYPSPASSSSSAGQRASRIAAATASILLGSVGAYTLLDNTPIAHCEGDEDTEDASEQSKKKSQSFRDKTTANYENRIRDYSAPDKVFRYFASVRVEGTIYMTPGDFIRAVTPGELQPKEVGLDLFAKKPSSYGVVSDPSKRLFAHNMSGALENSGSNGLISYAEFLFLLTLLSAPPRQFEFAFKMFDTDGNGTVDINEFINVQQAVQKGTPSGRKLGKMDSTSIGDADIQRSAVLQRLFGRDGKGVCTVKEFNAFLSEIQEDVLHIDFLCQTKDPTGKAIKEHDLAQMILRYARLRQRDQEGFMTRIAARTPNNPVSYEDVADLFRCLRSVDDLSLALSIFTRSGSGVSPDEFKRACLVASGVTLSEAVVDFVYHLFDADGDGSLSEGEFLTIMRNAGSRGLNNEKDLPIGRGFSALVKCIKHQIAQTLN